MKNKMVLILALCLFLFGAECRAYDTAVIGGVRNGTALGLMFESGFNNSAMLRLGIEASTSSSPGLVFGGAKWFLSNIRGGSPMFLSGGLVGYLGNNSQAGPYISLIFEHLLDVNPLFLEVGIDVVSSGRLQFQLGYFI